MSGAVNSSNERSFGRGRNCEGLEDIESEDVENSLQLPMKLINSHKMHLREFIEGTSVCVYVYTYRLLIEWLVFKLKFCYLNWQLKGF